MCNVNGLRLISREAWREESATHRDGELQEELRSTFPARDQPETAGRTRWPGPAYFGVYLSSFRTPLSLLCRFFAADVSGTTMAPTPFPVIANSSLSFPVPFFWILCGDLAVLSTTH